MPKYVIEREIPKAAELFAKQGRELSETSNRVIREMGDVQWLHRYVSGDKVYCVSQRGKAAGARAKGRVPDQPRFGGQDDDRSHHRGAVGARRSFESSVRPTSIRPTALVPPPPAPARTACPSRGSVPWQPTVAP